MVAAIERSCLELDGFYEVVAASQHIYTDARMLSSLMLANSVEAEGFVADYASEPMVFVIEEIVFVEVLEVLSADVIALLAPVFSATLPSCSALF